MGEKLKVGIFTADFDPVSTADLIFAQEKLESLGLDKVVFVPQRMEEKTSGPDEFLWLGGVLENYGGTFRAVHASDADRIEMVKRAVSEDDRFEYSDCLLNGRTAKNKLKGFFNGRHENWKLFFFEKDNFDAELEEKIRYDLSLKYFLPDAVADYIEKHKVYDSLIRTLAIYVKKNVNQHRFSHSIGVTRAAVRFAKRYGADVYKAELAGIFHDACKAKSSSLQHGPDAADLLKEKFGICDEDVYNAIYFHTTGRPKMSLLEKVIKMADLLEDGRTYSGIEALRSKMTDDVDESTLLCLREELMVLRSRDIPYDPITEEAIKWLDLYHRTKINK